MAGWTAAPIRRPAGWQWRFSVTTNLSRFAGEVEGARRTRVRVIGSARGFLCSGRPNCVWGDPIALTLVPRTSASPARSAGEVIQVREAERHQRADHADRPGQVDHDQQVAHGIATPEAPRQREGHHQRRQRHGQAERLERIDPHGEADDECDEHRRDAGQDQRLVPHVDGAEDDEGEHRQGYEVGRALQHRWPSCRPSAWTPGRAGRSARITRSACRCAGCPRSARSRWSC